MTRQITFCLALGALMLAGGGAYAAGRSLWRPAMPEFEIDARSGKLPATLPT